MSENKLEYNIKTQTVTAGAFTFEADGSFIGNTLKWWFQKSSFDKYEEKALDLMYMHYLFYRQLDVHEEYVPVGATLECSMGDEPMQLDTYMDHGVYTPSCKALMTCKDCVPGINIKGFGVCKCSDSVYSDLKHHPTWTGETHECFPVLEDTWKQETDEGTVWIANLKGDEFLEALRSKAYLVCIYGGYITVTGIPDEIEQPEQPKENEEESKKERIITFPDEIIGELNGTPKTLQPNRNWFSFLSKEKGTSLAPGNGHRYKISVGARILDPSYPDDGQLWLSDFDEKFLNTTIKVKLQHLQTNEEKIIECVVYGIKAHTYNTHPDPLHKIFEYNKNIKASFNCENGLVQTGIAYPRCSNAQNDNPEDGPIATGHMDGSSIEFHGTSTDFGANDYRLVEIIVIEDTNND